MNKLKLMLALVVATGLTSCKKEETKPCPSIIGIVEVRQYIEYRLELSGGVNKTIDYAEAKKLLDSKQKTYCD